MANKNPYYNKCKHLKFKYAKMTALCNSYSKVIAYCKVYACNIYDIKLKDEQIMCCVNLSPYTKLNCQYFKDKNNQTQLTQLSDFGGE